MRLILMCLILFSFSLYSTTKTVGTGGDYTTLKAAFDAINSGSITGAIKLEIISSTTETATATLNASGSGGANYMSVTIYPNAAGYTISGNLNNPLIYLNGADHVVIDGRIPGSCTGNNLSISNTNTTAFGNQTTIRLFNGAQNNKIQYCNISGAANHENLGIIFLASSVSGMGNSYNSISNNNIFGLSNLAVNGIHSSADMGVENTNNYILYNNIYNIWDPNQTCASIRLSSYNIGWVVKGNSIYQTASRTATTNSTSLHGIDFFSNSSNCVIQDNYIGGQSAQCGGSALSYTGTGTTCEFVGINIDGMSSSGTTIIKNNTIQNLTLSGASFYGIKASWYLNKTYILQNTIGLANSGGSITYNLNSIERIVGIYLGNFLSEPDSIFIEDNFIGSFLCNLNSSYNLGFRAIHTEDNNIALKIYRNTIGGSLSGILFNTESTSANNQIYGITSSKNSNNIQVSYNEIDNFRNNGVGINNAIIGIQINSGLVYNNRIADSFSKNNAGYDYGIYASPPNGAISRIYDNVISNISNENTSNPGNTICGVFVNAVTPNTASIDRNFIRHLRVHSTNNNASLYGILASGATAISNNIVNIGNGLDNDISIYGIYYYNPSIANKVVFNTISVSGTVSVGSDNTYAIITPNTNQAVNLQNNIFSNSRGRTTGTGNHFAISLPNATNLTINYNNYYAPNGIGGGILGIFNSIATATLATWQASTGQDANSLNTNPGFYNISEENPMGLICTNNLTGVSDVAYLQDFYGSIRRTPPRMGAIDGNYWTGNVSTAFANTGNWYNSLVPNNGENLIFHPAAVRNCELAMGQTFIAKNVISTQNMATNNIVLNANSKLAIGGEIKLSSVTKINAEASGLAQIEFTGTSQEQYIPTGTFINNTLDRLIINNPLGVYLEGNLTISNDLSFTLGKVYTSNENSSINKIILKDDATVSGASDTKYVVGSLEKIGDDQFLFPIGDENHYASIRISAPSNVTDAFEANYNSFNPSLTYAGNCVGSGLDHISNCEYWNINRTAGTSNVSVTLTWDSRSCGVTNLSDMRVAHWNGSAWEDVGNANTSGDVNEGSVTSNPVSSFSPFTLSSSTSANPLPIELAKFSAACNNNKNTQIKWTTAVEINNQYFEVEKSSDTKHWKSIGIIEGAINSNTAIDYEFTDVFPSMSYNYYRLKQVDTDGNHSFSNIVSTKCYQSNIQGINVYPNPTNNHVTIESENNSDNLIYTLSNSIGQKVQEGIISGNKQIIYMEQLPKGVYLLNMQNKDTHEEIKLLKN